MKNKTVFIGALCALGLWLLSAEVGQCFYNPERHGRGGGASPVSLANPAVSTQSEQTCGGLRRATGPMAKVKPFRCSTKYQDEETDLPYYGYRYYNASTGRWISRDPIEEAGGENIYCMLGNDAINRLDHLGLAPKLKYKTVDGPTSEDCGGFNWTIQWLLSEVTKQGGFAVQHVQWTFDVKDCSGNAVDIKSKVGYDPSALNYWEAWQFDVNKKVTIYNGNPNYPKWDDQFKLPAFGEGTKGTVAVAGDASYYDGLALPPSFKPDPSGPGGDLPVTTTDPTLSGGSTAVKRGITATWDCCCLDKKGNIKSKKTKLKVSK